MKNCQPNERSSQANVWIVDFPLQNRILDLKMDFLGCQAGWENNLMIINHSGCILVRFPALLLKIAREKNNNSNICLQDPLQPNTNENRGSEKTPEVKKSGPTF